MSDWFLQYYDASQKSEKDPKENWAEYLKAVKPLKIKKKYQDISSRSEVRLHSSFNSDLPKIKNQKESFVPFDPKLKRKISNKIPTLDLHGFSLSAAETELIKFVKRAIIHQHKFVLIITGKGKPDAEKTIKNQFVQFLHQSDLKDFIISISTAKPEHGGTGAYYIHIRTYK